MKKLKFVSRSNAKKLTGLSYLGSINSSAKTEKGKKYNIDTYIVYLAPANLSGYNVCMGATKECKLGCLHTSGRTAIEICSNKNIIQNARIKKTKLFFEQTAFFLDWITAEISAAKKLSESKGNLFAVRLNGTSDINYLNYPVKNKKNIFVLFPDIQFYDYTKVYNRFFQDMPANYHLTYSYTGRNKNNSLKVLQKGYNVAVIFNTKKFSDIPKTWNNYKIINGDLTDYRPADKKNSIVALTFKRIANKEINNAIKKSIFVEQI